MKEELLKKAIQGENSEVLDPTTKTVWNLRGVSEEEIIATAKEINEQLGYELFDDLDYETLISDFSKVSRERYKYALEKSEFRNDRLEKAVREHSDDILVDVIKAHENFDSMELLEIYNLAFAVNKKLGYRLFRDIYSYSLKRDFERVAIAVKVYKEEGKIVKFMKQKSAKMMILQCIKRSKKDKRIKKRGLSLNGELSLLTNRNNTLKIILKNDL